jgi:hypothetical protein
MTQARNVVPFPLTAEQEELQEKMETIRTSTTALTLRQGHIGSRVAALIDAACACRR